MHLVVMLNHGSSFKLRFYLYTLNSLSHLVLFPGSSKESITMSKKSGENWMIFLGKKLVGFLPVDHDEGTNELNNVSDDQ